MTRAGCTAISQKWNYGNDCLYQKRSWKERYNELRYLHALGGMPEPQAEDLVLPSDAFPHSGAGSTVDADNFARKMAADIQGRFGRTGFAHEDGHVVPIDQTTPAQGSGHVNAMKNKFGG